MNNLELFETAVNQFDVVEDITDLAMIETGLIIQDTLEKFSVIESVGQVILVSFVATSEDDPTMPIIINSGAKIRSVARQFATVLYKPLELNFYKVASVLGLQYIDIATSVLNDIELDFFTKQVQICIVNPTRKKFN